MNGSTPGKSRDSETAASARLSALIEDVAFLAAMLEFAPSGAVTASEYERLGRLAAPYLAARFEREDAEVRALSEEDDHAVT